MRILKLEDEEDYYEEETTDYVLIAIRMESEKLLFCVETIFTAEGQPSACENLEEVSISSLVDEYGDEIVVRALEKYVRILSDNK